MGTREAFLEDLASKVDSWTGIAVQATTDASADLEWTENAEAFRRVQEALAAAQVPEEDVHRVFSKCLRGLAMSTLSIIDGATKLADEVRIRIVDENDEALGEALRDDFALHWLDTRGRSEPQ